MCIRDRFNRWEAGQRLLTRTIESFDDQVDSEHNNSRKTLLVDAFAKALDDRTIDSAFMAELLLLPDIETIAESHDIFEIDRLADNKLGVQHMLVAALENQLGYFVQQTTGATFSMDTGSIGKRTLSNVCLDYLARSDNGEWIRFVRDRFGQSNNMTDQLSALKILVELDTAENQIHLNDFYQRWKGERLVIDKWFSIQAVANTADSIDRVSNLLGHHDFDLRNPNRVRSLLGAFSVNNHVAFHSKNGRGYQLLAEQAVILDDINPQVAARLLAPLTRWKRMSVDRRELMKRGLQLVADKPRLSRDVFEVVNRALDR